MHPDHEREFEEFVRARGLSLLRAAYLLTGDRGHAEDLLQLALERLSRHWHRLDSPPDAYARRCLTTLAIDRWRYWKRRPEHVDSAPAQRETGDSAPAFDERQMLIQALRDLSPMQRAVVVLRYWEDYSEADTAALLQCSRGSVKTHASRGLARLRQILSAESQGRSRRQEVLK